MSNPASAIDRPAAPWMADLALLTVAAFWGVNIPIMKFAIQRMDPYCFNALRLTCSAVVLGLLAWPELRTLAGKQGLAWIRIGLFSVISGAIYHFAFVSGMARTTSGNTALIVSALPMWVALIAGVFVAEKLNRRAWTGLLITLAGTIIVTIPKGGFSLSSGYLVGNLLILAATLTWAIASVLSRPILRSLGPTALAAIACITMLPLHYVVAWPQLANGWEAVTRQPRVATALVYSGVCSTGLAYALWNYSVHQVGASHAAIFQNLVPVIAVLLGWFMLNEVPTAMQIMGGVLIIGGLLVMRRQR